MGWFSSGKHSSTPDPTKGVISKSGKHWETSDGEKGHDTTIKYNDGTIEHYSHIPNNSKPNGWTYNPSTGETHSIRNGKKD